MVAAADPRPTAQQLEELIEAVRRDPSSTAFITLGEAYLALGRPRDAVGVGGVGLQAVPNSIEGRVMVGRAYALMHAWKEAQNELLKVVKVDRSNRLAFALLGEVLLRRADFDRAIPVLQHAQILDPTSPSILSMLKRARAGQQLDPPPPVPQPVPPRDDYPPQQQQQAYPVVPQPQMPPQMQMPPPQVQQAPQIQALPQAARMIAPPPPPPPQGIPADVRPRVLPKAKVQNAAAASLRQSAAVGEAYLNELLAGGLLEVAGVRVPDVEFDLRPDRRWGRSTRRAFIFLLVVLVLGGGSGGTWYWWSTKQKSEQFTRTYLDVKAKIVNAEYAKMVEAAGDLKKLRDKSPDDTMALALTVEVVGVEGLLYGTPLDDATAAVDKLGSELGAGDPGYRELVIGKCALELAKLDQAIKPSPDGKATLAELAKTLDDYLATDKDDRWARWLRARVHVQLGERTDADAAFKLADDGADGFVVAIVDEAELLARDGNVDKAVARYQAALDKVPKHMLAQIGRTYTRALADVDARGVITEDLDALDKNLPPRVEAYRALSEALGRVGIEDFEKVDPQLKIATGAGAPSEVWFWSGVAWVGALRGRPGDVDAARAKAPSYGKGKLEDDPLIRVLDAAAQLRLGRADKAFEIAAKLTGTRALGIKAYALLELGKPKEALTAAGELVKATTPRPRDKDDTEEKIASLEARMLEAEAQMASSADANAALEPAGVLRGIALNMQAKTGRHAYGRAWRTLGKWDEARQEFENATKDIDETKPNPYIERSYAALADVAATQVVLHVLKPADAQADLDAAKAALDKALKANKDYVPAQVAAAKVLMRTGDADGAAQALDKLDKLAGDGIPAIKLALAEALLLQKSPDRDRAKSLIEQVKDKVLPSSEVGRVAYLYDPALADEYKLPVPPEVMTKPATPAPTPAPPPPPRRR